MSGASELTAGTKICETKFAHRQDESDALIETNTVLGAVQIEYLLSPGQVSAKGTSRAVFPKFFTRECLLISKTTTYPNILPQVNIECPDDKDPK
jgi:hypothetical protein